MYDLTTTNIAQSDRLDAGHVCSHLYSIVAPSRNVLSTSWLPPDRHLARRLTELKRSIWPREGTLLFQTGERVDSVYFIVAGAVRLVTMRPDDRRQILAFALPGDAIGLCAGPVYSYHAEAIIRTHAWAWPSAALERVAGQQPALARWLEGLTCRELHRAHDHIQLLERRSTRERVALFLLRLAQRQTSAGTVPASVCLPMSRTDLADHLCIRSESISRVLNALYAERALEPFKGRRAVILSLDRLVAAAGLTV
jgi:CRP/FNR family transcriptional regulator, nitrogen fixation regulation protein